MPSKKSKIAANNIKNAAQCKLPLNDRTIDTAPEKIFKQVILFGIERIIIFG
jgi:hypothetical protein